MPKGSTMMPNSMPKLTPNEPKSMQKATPWRSWELRGAILDSIQKSSRGIVRFGEAFGSSLPPRGSQKLPQCFFVGPFWEPFWNKNRKSGIQKGIPKFNQTNIEKVCQKASKMMPKWRDESVIAHAPEKKVKNEQLLVFPIENVVRTM